MKELLEGLGYPVVAVPPAGCASRESALSHLVHALVRAGRLPGGEAPAVAAALAEREARGATALGNGLALPHLATAAMARAEGVVGLAADGIPWPGGFDGRPVRYVCLLLTPAAKPLEMLLAEEAVVRHLFASPKAREQAVRLRSYRDWEAAGRPGGGDVDFWLRAERDLAAGR